jgi:hypothetical protein
MGNRALIGVLCWAGLWLSGAVFLDGYGVANFPTAEATISWCGLITFSGILIVLLLWERD